MKTPTVTTFPSISVLVKFATFHFATYILEKKSKTCTFGGAGFKERETYLKICLFVGLWNYFQQFTESNSTSSVAFC